MTAADFDWDDEPAYFEDYWDDDPVFVKEEPDCFACNDSGVIYRESGRRCRSCRPTRVERWWFGLRWRVREWRFRHRVGGSAYDDEVPF